MTPSRRCGVARAELRSVSVRDQAVVWPSVAERADPVTADALIADLSRLLREGLVQVDWSFEADVPRFAITRRGRVVAESETVCDPV